jgi:hypothetical protein
MPLLTKSICDLSAYLAYVMNLLAGGQVNRSSARALMAAPR